MTKTIRPNPTDLDGNTDLDMRVSRETGEELKAEILESVSATQRFLQTTLPDRLIVTQRQFLSLQHDLTEMDHTTDRLYITPMNAMYVVIDREVDTVEAVETVMKDTEELKEAIRDVDAADENKPQD